MLLFGDVAQEYRAFAAYADGDSPTFAAWARAVAEDDDVLAWLARLPEIKRQPNLVFAAARWHGVAAPGPYDGLRWALLGPASGEIERTILARATQTNEVGRLATLLPAFAQVEGPLALLEVGASAGLCLYPDRWAYEWTTDDGVVRLGEGPALPCRVEGPAPLPTALPAVAWRGGIDLNPLDVTDPDAMAWLTNLVWPEQDHRRARLEQAIAVARREPPTLVAGDLLDALPALVEQAGEHGTVVVFHSAVIAYLDLDDRARYETLVRGLVEDGRCRWVSNEGRRVIPAITATRPSDDPDGATFVLGLDGQALADTHGHGASMRWLV